LFKFALVACGRHEKPRTWCRTFLAALKAGRVSLAAAREELAGRHLENKICDHFRKASRETSFTICSSIRRRSDKFIPDGLFKGGWIHDAGRETGAMEWSSDPGRASTAGVLENISRLFQQDAENVATVFTMRRSRWRGKQGKSVAR